MSIRGHVQIQQTKYGNKSLSSWVDNRALYFLSLYDVSINESQGGNQWEIEIDEAFNSFVQYLEKNPAIFDDCLNDTLKGNGYGDDLLALLKEGISAAEKNGYSTICIDWW